MYFDIAWTIIGPAIAFTLGLAWRRLTQIIVDRRAREFWRPLISGNLSIIVGRHRLLLDYERSGLIGVGDLLTVNSLARHLENIGLRKYAIHYNDHLARPDGQPDPLTGNLVAIGGPDANLVTRDLLARLPTRLEFAYLDRNGSGQLFTLAEAIESITRQDHGVRGALARLRQKTRPSWNTPVLLDHAESRILIPSNQDSEPGTDVGIVIRSVNPFDPSSEVLVVAGAYGHGALGAIQYIQSKDFQRQLPTLGQSFECVVEVDVIQDMPQNTRLRLARSIQPATTSTNSDTKALPQPEHLALDTANLSKRVHRNVRNWTIWSHT